MSSRFHQKYHRYNHHSVVPSVGGNQAYPDAGYDPIASFDSPFQGTFFSQGDLVTTKNLSAGTNLIVERDGNIKSNLTLGFNLSVGNNLLVGKDVRILGDLSVLGQTTTLETEVYVTSAIDIQNVGVGPALKVTQSGTTPIAWFIDREGSSVIIANNSYMGIGTTTPLTDLHVKRDQGQPSEIRVEGDQPSISLVNGGATKKFEMLQSSGGATIVKSNSFSEALGEVYKIQLPPDAGGGDVVTILSGGNVGISTIAPNKKLTVNGELSSSNTTYAPRISINTSQSTKELTINGSLSCGQLIIPNSTVVLPTSGSIALPPTNDVVFKNQTNSLAVSAFNNGVSNVVYTLTNKGAHSIFIQSSSRLSVRGESWSSKKWSFFKCNNNVNPFRTWSYFKCANGGSTATELELAPNFSCSLRMDNETNGSIW